MPVNIMWFKRDLRISDNHALLEATSAKEPLICIYNLDSERILRDDVDGIHIKWSIARQLEYQSAFYAEIPELAVLVAGDMLYNNCHLFLGERLQDGQPNATQWLSQLRNIDFSIYRSIIPGHGAVGDSGMVQTCIEYLEAIIPIITLPGMPTDLYKNKAIQKFPNHKVQDMLDLSGFFLYDFQGL